MTPTHWKVKITSIIPMIQLQDKDFARNLHVVQSELYLKCAIIHGTAHFPLPFLPDELAFVRRGRSGGETITTALWFETGSCTSQI